MTRGGGEQVLAVDRLWNPVGYPIVSSMGLPMAYRTSSRDAGEKIRWGKNQTVISFWDMGYPVTIWNIPPGKGISRVGVPM